MTREVEIDMERMMGLTKGKISGTLPATDRFLASIDSRKEIVG